MNEDNRASLIVAIYSNAMEEIIERRRIEWQTFLAMNAIYGFALKVLIDLRYKLPPYLALTIVAIAVLFTYIWFIRVYGSAKRAEFSRELRNRIQKIDYRVRNLMPSHDKAGGWIYWNRRYFSRKIAKYEGKWCKGDRAWPLWGQRGICTVMCLYCLIFGAGVLIYRTAWSSPIIGYSKMLQDDLNKCTVPDSLRKEFNHNGISLSPYAKPEKSDSGWLVRDRGNRYILRKEEGDIIRLYRRDRDIKWILITSVSVILVFAFIFFVVDKIIMARSEVLLFDVPVECPNYLQMLRKGEVPDALKRKFEYQSTLSGNYRVKQLFNRFVIVDKDKKRLYSVEEKNKRLSRLSKKREHKLNVYELS